jgi:transposase
LFFSKSCRRRRKEKRKERRERERERERERREREREKEREKSSWGTHQSSQSIIDTVYRFGCMFLLVQRITDFFSWIGGKKARKV